jgi:hypothetical protein
MLTQDPVTGDRREQPRSPVNWQARCNTRDRMCTGLLRDVHAQGGFFEVHRDEEAVARRPLAAGDAVLIRYVVSPYYRWITVRAVICWVGNSVEHGCVGVGFEFTGPLPRDTCGIPLP